MRKIISISDTVCNWVSDYLKLSARQRYDQTNNVTIKENINGTSGSLRIFTFNFKISGNESLCASLCDCTRLSITIVDHARAIARGWLVRLFLYHSLMHHNIFVNLSVLISHNDTYCQLLFDINMKNDNFVTLRVVACLISKLRGFWHHCVEIDKEIASTSNWCNTSLQWH